MTTRPVANLLKWQLSLIIIVVLLAAGFMLNSQSLWIDEGGTAELVVASDPLRFLEDRGSSLQMPGFIVGLWTWEKIAGSSEYGLRSFNLVWIFIAAIATLCIWKVRPLFRLLTITVLVLSPFVWFYMNEARPYAMQISMGMLAMVATYNIATLTEGKRRVYNLSFFLLGTLLLSSSSLFAMVFSFFMFVALGAIWLLRPDKLKEDMRNKYFWVVLMGFAVPFLALALFFYWTLNLGAKASGIGNTTLANLAYAQYELFGFNGLGPSKDSIRSSMVQAFAPYLTGLAAMGLAYVGFTFAVARQLLKNKLRIPAWAVCMGCLFLTCTVVGFAIGYWGGFRFLGRHLSPIFPLYAMAMGWAIWLVWGSLGGRITTITLLVLLLLSSLNLRLDYRFTKDDYRSAAKLAIERVNSGELVWWAANRATAEYYGIEFNKNKQVKLLYTANLDDHELEHLLQIGIPDTIILSKLDVYDIQGSLQRLISDSNFVQVQNEPKSFTVWRKKVSPK